MRMRLFGIDSRLLISVGVALIICGGLGIICINQDQQSESSSIKTSLSQALGLENFVTKSQENRVKKWSNCADLELKTLQIAAVLIGGVWAFDKFLIYREGKIWIQFDIDANLYEMIPDSEQNWINLTTYSWNKKGERISYPDQNCTHAVEVLLKFTNKGKTRFRLFNAQIAIKTILETDGIHCAEEDGHLSIQRVFTSGNIVKLMPVEKTRCLCRQDENKTSFYYIEPGVEQTIHFLAAIPRPRGLLQVIGEFSLENKRIFPKKKTGSTGLYPHQAVRTYQIDRKGCLVKG